MRRKDREITDRAELLRILRAARVCRLAMSDVDRPYLVPLSYALDGEDLVLHSARTGRKIDILRRNPAVCFEVEEGVEVAVGPSPCETGMRFRTVIGHGVAELVEDLAERARLLGLFGPRYGAPDRQLPARELERTAVLRIRVRELTGKRCPAED
jgi:nitroimidazol reductase NimA-like FMN-containing flavoprotein (pyridoxamine 5'-phosphate oxidase superfamily)